MRNSLGGVPGGPFLAGELLAHLSMDAHSASSLGKQNVLWHCLWRGFGIRAQDQGSAQTRSLGSWSKLLHGLVWSTAVLWFFTQYQGKGQDCSLRLDPNRAWQEKGFPHLSPEFLLI